MNPLDSWGQRVPKSLISIKGASKEKNISIGFPVAEFNKKRHWWYILAKENCAKIFNKLLNTRDARVITQNPWSSHPFKGILLTRHPYTPCPTHQFHLQILNYTLYNKPVNLSKVFFLSSVGCPTELSNLRSCENPSICSKTGHSVGNLGNWGLQLPSEIRAVLQNWAVKPVNLMLTFGSVSIGLNGRTSIDVK